MNNIESIINSLSKQNSIAKTLTGNFGGDLAKMVAASAQANFQAHSLGNISNIARAYTSHNISDSVIKAITASNFTSSYSQLNKALSSDFISSIAAFQGISGSLQKQLSTNALLSDKLSAAFQNQISISKSLGDLSKLIPQQSFNQFSAISAAIQGLSNQYFTSLVKKREWEELEDFEEATEGIIAVTTQITNNNAVTVADLEDFKITLVKELSATLKKTKTEKVKAYILDLMTLISFLFTFYTAFLSDKPVTDDDIKRIISYELTSYKEDVRKLVEFKLAKMYANRIASTNVYLRFSNRKNSKILGLVRKEQKVYVLEIRHKWLLISYIDPQTQKPMAGFVYKKYFKPTD